MKYLSLCSGIEAASVAWHTLGWEAVAFSEIEPFPCAVLAHHYPTVPNWGDMTGFQEWPHASPDILVGGTPCQSFSVAGLRAGLDDPRGQLMLVYGAIARKYRPRWLVWENVPGVLSSNGDRDFGAFLGMLAELGYGFAYRVLDAQHFGVPQRRRRVFVVGYLGDWRRAAAVLFERHSLSGHPPPRREAREDVAGTIEASANRSRGAGTSPGMISPTLPARTQGGGGMGTDFDLDGGLIARPLTAHPGGARMDFESETFGAHTLRAKHDASEDGTGRGTPLVPVCGTMRANGEAHSGFRHRDGLVPVAFDWQGSGKQTTLGASADGTGSLGTSKTPALLSSAAVRRLTVRECERLMGLPDDYTLVPFRGKPAVDGPRYKALGNSMAVPVMAWIGERIRWVQASI